MKNVINITQDLFYIGCSDRKLALFENIYPIPDGVSYNSYFLNDEKTVLFDTVDKNCAGQFFDNLNALLKTKKLDYFIINHLEPDHSALIKDVIEKFPDVKIVLNQKAQQMLYQFFEFNLNLDKNIHIVKEGDTLSTGSHELTFISAPMVHWPEVMVTYDKKDKILFSADAFGSFGAINGNLFDNEVDFDSKIDEYRRYYSNIVGKYGMQVNSLLNKAKNIEIKLICPLHGLLIKENIAKIVQKYTLWANYTPEIDSVLIAYASVYGGTQNASEILASKLASRGLNNILMFDVSHTHPSYILSKMFEYSKIVLASTTYNNNIFVSMDNLIKEIINHNLQNRTFAIIENGSWVCKSGDLISSELGKLKNIKIIDKKINIKSTAKNAQEADFDELAQMIKG